MTKIMEQSIVFCLLTLAVVTLADLSDHSCPENEIFRPTGGPRCENCGPRCLVFDATAKCYCKSGYSRVNGNCIANKECPPLKTPRSPMENPDLYDGDILGVELDENRNAVAYDYQLWPGGVVPFVLDDQLGYPQRVAILDGMEHIQETTCIKFVPRTVEKDYIRIIHGKGCYSRLGREGIGEQPLSIGEDCQYRGTAIHELLHSLGFNHEHKRSDRNDYVDIYWQNIIPGMEHNFVKLKPFENRLLTEFDWNSIMLYPSTAFTDGTPGRYSMLRKDRSVIEAVSERDMSPIDIRRVKMLYKCPN